MEPGLVSTVVPVFNRADLLTESVLSVLGQTYRPIEVVIVDDGSTDDTPAAIRALTAQHPQVKSVRIENGGPGVAREAGRQLARGEFIQYLDSDDLLLPRRFELLVAALRADTEAGVAYGMTRYCDMNGREIAPTWKDPNQVHRTMFPSFLVGRWWDTPSPLYRRSVTDAAGAWTSLRCEEDWEYDARIAALGTRLCFVPQVLMQIRMHRGSLSSSGGSSRHLSDRAQAHDLIYRHAYSAAIGSDSPEMQHFARELFLLARQCGAAGLENESTHLFELSRAASGRYADRLQFRLYAFLARSFGWKTLGKASAMLDRIRTFRAPRSSQRGKT